MRRCLSTKQKLIATVRPAEEAVAVFAHVPITCDGVAAMHRGDRATPDANSMQIGDRPGNGFLSRYFLLR